jgi:hypothetical protein
MSTLKSLKKIAAHYVFMQQAAGDVDENFSAIPPIVLGIIHIFLALFSVALGIGSICTHASGYFIAYGIWCGFIFLVVGFVTLVNACIRNSAMITTSMVFNTVAWCAAAVQFSLGIVAAANDANESDRYSNSLLTDRYDIYYSRIYNHHCAGRKDFYWRQWGAVDVLLILVGFFESVVALICIVLCVRSICCGRVYTEEVTERQLANNGYHDGYGMAPSVMYME